jgi:hypothetical protein
MYNALPSFRSEPKPSAQDKINGRLEENKLTSSSLNYRTPTLVWYAALKQHTEPSHKRNNIFNMVLRETDQFYPMLKENLIDTLHHASHLISKPDLNTDVLQVLETA